MINQFYIDYIKAIENPNRVGWNGKVWTAPQYKGYDKNQRGYGIDIIKNDSAKRLTQNRPGQWLTEGEADKLMREHLLYVYGAAQKHIEGFDNLSDRRKAALLGMLYRGDSVNKNRHIININEPDDNKFFESISNYYKSKGLNERAKNSSNFFNNQTNFLIPMKWEQWEPPMKFKSGGQVRKMLTAAGGPIKRPIKRLKDGYRYISDEENGGWDRISDNAMSDVFATMEFTPKKTTVGSSITRKQSAPSKTYYSAYNPDDIVKGFNALTLGGLNNLSPTLWARRLYDTGKLATRNMTWSGYTNSWINGNNGLVSLEFAENNPYLSTGINIAGDIIPISLASTPLSVANAIDLTGHILIPGVAGGVGGIYIGNKAEKYLPEKYKNLAVPLGYGIGAITGLALGATGLRNNIRLKTKYTKINDIVNYPTTTAAATILGKYPWTKRLNIKLKRQLFDDIKEARDWQINSGYDRIYLPAIKILKRDLYPSGSLGYYIPGFHRIEIMPTMDKYSNLPLETIIDLPSHFKGVVNHELTHGRLHYFGLYSRYDPLAGFYVTRDDLNMKSLEPFRTKQRGAWIASPDEFDAELSNLLIMNGKSAFEPLDNIRPLMKRFSMTKQEAKNFEKDILEARRSQEFFKQGGMLELLKKGSKIHIKKKNRGKFTAYCGGNVTSACIAKAKASGNPTLIKRATFAANARKWKHKEGGIIKAAAGTQVNTDTTSKKFNWNSALNTGVDFIGQMLPSILGGNSSSLQIPDTSSAMTDTTLLYLLLLQQQAQAISDLDTVLKSQYDPENPNANGGDIVRKHYNWLLTSAKKGLDAEAEKKKKDLIDTLVANLKANTIGSLLLTGLGLVSNYIGNKKGSSVS